MTEAETTKEGVVAEGVVAEEEGDDVNLIKRVDRLQNEVGELKKFTVRQTAMIAGLVGMLVANGTITQEDALVVVQAGVDDQEELKDERSAVRWLRHEILHGSLRKKK